MGLGVGLDQVRPEELTRYAIETSARALPTLGGFSCWPISETDPWVRSSATRPAGQCDP